MKVSCKTFIAFLLTLTLCASLIVVTVTSKMKIEQLKMEQLISEKGAKALEVITRLLYKTHTLSALVLQSNGAIENFDRVAATILDDPAIINILIAPGGVVSHVYPHEGNEAVIGLDFFSEGAGNQEAILAKELGQLVFGGPFDLVQGGQALVGRLPVYLDSPDGKKEFWGLVSVTLRYPEVLQNAGFSELQFQGFAYEIWRISPETNEKQIITSSGYPYNKNTRYIEKPLKLLNADWFFRILPVNAWYEYPETWVFIFLGLCISLLVAFVMQNNSELKRLKHKFEILAITDSLTGIYNRRHFIETARVQMEVSAKSGKGSYIIIFDIDNYKAINDTYGHTVGDNVLKEIVTRVNEIIRPYDLFARYGGDEFIMLAVNVNEKDIRNLVERIRLNIFETPFDLSGEAIAVSTSFGVAPAAGAGGLEHAIKLADKALYNAKAGGRNKADYVDA